MLVFGQIKQNAPNLHLVFHRTPNQKQSDEESPGEVEGEVGRGHGVVGHDTLGSLSNNNGDGYGNFT